MTGELEASGFWKEVVLSFAATRDDHVPALAGLQYTTAVTSAAGIKLRIAVGTEVT